MPTIIALDVSLSMARFVPFVNEEITFHQLAVHGINFILDYLSENARLEQVSFLIFSNLTEVIVEFTRDYELIRNALKTDHFDKTNIEGLFQTVSSIFQSTWGTQNYCNLVMITDCGLGMGSSSVKNMLLSLQCRARSRSSSELLPFPFPSNVSVMCLGHQKDSKFVSATSQYQSLLDVSKQKGQIYVMGGGSEESPVGKSTAEALFSEMVEKNYKPFEAVLKCGSYQKLESNVLIWPPPLPYQAKDVFGTESSYFLSHKIEICGYLNLGDIGSPMTVSRHLILPKVSVSTPEAKAAVKGDLEKLEGEIRGFYSKSESSSVDEEGKSAESESNKENVCVLLHGALKIENVAALALLGDNWFGFIYSFADSKKKSNLMLAVLPPGSDVVPWLGDLRYLGMVEDAPGDALSFPLKPVEKRSYSQNIVVWIRRAGLQSDIQKVLRHAKKLPEKTTHFYKELNRIKRAALSLGFVELLDGLAVIFECEIAQLPSTTSPDCALQLKHAAMELRKLTNHDFKAVIVALPTKYNQL